VLGTVSERGTGDRIPNAHVLVLVGRQEGYIRKVLETGANSSGYFALELPAGSNYSICVYYDNPLTPGFDYVPSVKTIYALSGARLNLSFELYEGASLLLDGEVLFVETAYPEKPVFAVLDPESREIMKFGDFTLKFGELDFPNKYLELDPNHVIVPAGIPFMIGVYSGSEISAGNLDVIWYSGSNLISQSFIIDRPDHFLLEKGETIHVDLTEFSVLNGLSTVKRLVSEVQFIIRERKEEGFYLALEEQRLSRTYSLIHEAEYFLNQGEFEFSFAKLREAYTEASDLKRWLDEMRIEAYRSVFLILPFLALTASAISFLFFEGRSMKVIAAFVVFLLLLLATYLLYPGSRIVEAPIYFGASLASLISVLSVLAVLPMFMRGGEFRGRVPLKNLVVPVLSIAKRNLRRRRLRFILTLISITILVSSFVSLTSFTTGYGLSFSRVSKMPGLKLGMLVRTLRSPVMRAYAPASGGKGVLWFTPLEDSMVDWFRARPYVRLVSPKYESTPRRQYDYMGSYNPLGYIEDHPIFGVLGIIPSIEAEILPLEEMIVEGRFLRDEDENSVLISKELEDELKLGVGDWLVLQLSGRNLTLRVVGVLDDRRLEALKDIDGSPYLPMKIVELGRTELEEGVSLVLEGLAPCSAKETLVTTWKIAYEIPGVGISRIDLVLEEGEDPKEYAKMIALNKGLRAWASTQDGLYLAQLAPYFQGKGLSVAIPWIIVVLNVVTTMLNSLYERKKEILIYSSIGISPSQMACIFLAEAGIIGVIGGGTGYLLGFGWYKVMSHIAANVQVKQKVSALWTVGAMAVSMAAVLVGGLTALKGSVIITPSLKRRWRIDERKYKLNKPFKLALPIWIAEEEVDDFMNFMLKALKSRKDDYEEHTYVLGEGMEELDGASVRSIEFFYTTGGQTSPFHTRNKFVLRKERGSDTYAAELLSDGLPEAVQRTGSFIRKVLLEWNVKRGRLRGKDDDRHYGSLFICKEKGFEWMRRMKGRG